MHDYSGFYKLSIAERRQRIGITWPDKLDLAVADHMVENLVSTLELPLGIASYFVIDGQPLWVPMAIEEPSVIAAASHMAKLASLRGGFQTQVDEPIMMGHIQLLDSPDWDRVRQVLTQQHEHLVQLGNSFCPGLKARGGGCLSIAFKPLSPTMAVVEVRFDCRDAMGANVINTVLEGLAPKIEELAGCKTGFKILSNLSDQRLARAHCEISYSLLAQDNTRDFGRSVAERMVLGYQLAQLDPYRACTHNKGVMNGIDAVVIATGNDWRAVEAGAHAYASQRPGGYGPLTHLELDDTQGCLKAKIELPLALGVVGGISNAHPTVKTCLEILGNFGTSAQLLSGVVASVGLAQNLAALRALAAEGIQKGHMALHGRKNA